MDNCDLNQLSISSRRIFLYLKCYYKIKKKVSTQNINIEKIRLVLLYIYIRLKVLFNLFYTIKSNFNLYLLYYLLL